MNARNPAPAGQGMAGSVDKVFLEILNNRLNGITSEMGHIIHKASFTPFIKEAWDFGEALVNLKGEIFSYPRDIGVAFMATALMDELVAHFMKDCRPGDVLVCNDPNTSGGLCTHLPDIHLLKPFFWEGELLCFSWTFIHSSDVGGLVPGSIAPSAYDIFQEGFRIPPTKLYREGKINQDLVDLFLSNCRIPFYNWGDLKALLAAMDVADKRLRQTIEKYGVDRVRSGMEDLLAWGEQRARQIISNMPDGAYEFHDYIELDITGEPPARIKLRLEISGDDMHLDFTGTDPQVRAALNLPTDGKNHHFINAGVFNFFHSVDKSAPLNRGMVRPLRLTIPRGTIINPEKYAAVGVRFATAVRVMDIIIAALSLALESSQGGAGEGKGILPAAGSGLLGVSLLSYIDSRTGETRVNVLQPMWGGSGARPTKDAIDGADFAAGFLRNIPAETSEAEMPILIHKYQLSGEPPAPGKYRGGLGIDFAFQIFAPNAIVTARGMERFLFRPWGRKGGSHGSLARTIVNPGTPAEKSIGKISSALQPAPGDVIQIITPSGGGYGDPLERDPARVLKDVSDGLISIATASTDYGVVIAADLTVDAPATESARRERQRIGPVAEFDFGPERDQYESAFTPEIQDALMRALVGVPASQRQFYKSRVWSEITLNGKARVPTVQPAEIGAILERCRKEVTQVLI
ncbi:MAG: hydantoinase B/oxoprolinase family protein [Betaproteobacteria bacterium]|nr:hydantoinase B/oxoprolinase family protein [Betaproteobacteria bacterium]